MNILKGGGVEMEIVEKNKNVKLKLFIVVLCVVIGLLIITIVNQTEKNNELTSKLESTEAKLKASETSLNSCKDELKKTEDKVLNLEKELDSIKQEEVTPVRTTAYSTASKKNGNKKNKGKNIEQGIVEVTMNNNDTEELAKKVSISIPDLKPDIEEAQTIEPIPTPEPIRAIEVIDEPSPIRPISNEPKIPKPKEPKIIIKE